MCKFFVFTASLRRCGFGLIFLMAGQSAWADPAIERVKSGIARYTQGKVIVDSAKPTPIPGIFEIISGADLFYADATGRYAFVEGRLIDTEKHQDLSQAALDNIARVDQKRFPLDLAIKKVVGNGKRTLVIFEDPNCPMCREFHASLAGLTDVTLYIFPFPIISESSVPAAALALCAPVASQASVWDGLMSGTAPLPEKIETPCLPTLEKLKTIIALGEKHNIRNTPTTFLPDGRRIVGKMPFDQLADALSNRSK